MSWICDSIWSIWFLLLSLLHPFLKRFLPLDPVGSTKLDSPEDSLVLTLHVNTGPSRHCQFMDTSDLSSNPVTRYPFLLSFTMNLTVGTKTSYFVAEAIFIYVFIYCFITFVISLDFSR
jgi:hypothetical protein